MAGHVTPRVVAVDEPWSAKVHIVAGFEPDAYKAACGVVVRGALTPARTIDVDRRCAANGCRNRWPAHLRAVS